MYRGFSLKHADLAGVNLVHHHKQGYDFFHVDFYRANLSNAHLFQINLQHASLMKANLSAANLHNANFQACNLLGVKWQNAKIKNLHIGDELVQEIEAKQAREKFDMVLELDLWEQSEEIYRDLRKHAEREGIFPSC